MELDITILSILVILIIFVIMIVLITFRTRKYKKKLSDSISQNNDLQQKVQNLELSTIKLEQEPAVIHEHYKTKIQGFEEKFLMIQEDHKQTIQENNMAESVRLTEQTLVHTTEIEKLKEKHRAAQKKSFTLGGNQVIGDISQIAGIFHTMSEYEHFSLITSVSKQASYDAIGMSKDQLDFIEFKTKGARLTGKEGWVKKLIEEGKVRHRIIDVILPPDLQLKDRK